MTTFSRSDDLRGAEFHGVDLRGARFGESDLSGVVMRGVDIAGADIDAPWLSEDGAVLLVNGVDVVPLVEAELNRRFPGRELQKAQTPEGLREGWVAVQAAWQETVAATPDDLVDAHVEDEWSLAQTLRHLVLATDAWLGLAILGKEQPFHEIGLPFTGASLLGLTLLGGILAALGAIAHRRGLRLRLRA